MTQPQFMATHELGAGEFTGFWAKIVLGLGNFLPGLEFLLLLLQGKSKRKPLFDIQNAFW